MSLLLCGALDCQHLAPGLALLAMLARCVESRPNALFSRFKVRPERLIPRGKPCPLNQSSSVIEDVR